MKWNLTLRTIQTIDKAVDFINNALLFTTLTILMSLPGAIVTIAWWVGLDTYQDVLHEGHGRSPWPWTLFILFCIISNIVFRLAVFIQKQGGWSGIKKTVEEKATQEKIRALNIESDQSGAVSITTAQGGELSLKNGQYERLDGPF